MKIEFTLKNLNCPNCAKEIAHELQKLKCVRHAEIDLLTQNLKMQIDPQKKDEIFELTASVVRKLEPDVKVIPQSTSSQNGALPQKDYGYVILGGLIAITGIASFYTAVIPQHVSVVIILFSYFILGWEVLVNAARNIIRGHIFDENFLMSIASLGAIAIGEYPEAAAVMLLYEIGEIFEDRALNASRHSIRALLNIRPDRAHVLRNRQILEVHANDVKIGEWIIVYPGERIPLDGIVTKGSSSLDMRALTGESMPVAIASGQNILSGAINMTQTLTIRVTEIYENSTASKIIQMVRNAGSHKAQAENFITSFARFYTPAIVCLATALAVIPPIFGGYEWSESLRRGFVFLVISCPCALVISIPLAFFAGIGRASKNGILIKGGNYLEALTKMKNVIFDKTGTLTHGSFDVVSICPAPEISQNALLQTAAIAESMSNHPIAKSIMTEIHKKGIHSVKKATTFDEIAGLGIRCRTDDDEILAGNAQLLQKYSVGFSEFRENAGTVVYFAQNNNYIGCIVIADTLKSNAADVIRDLRRYHVKKSIMLTGDTYTTARTIAQKLDIDEFYAELLPADKVKKFEILSSQTQKNEKTAFVGDGINDAPVLARADIGIAMGGIGSDAAVEAADIVLLSDDLSKLPEAVDIANRTHQIVWQNIIFALGVKFFILVMGTLGRVDMWSAVFADVGVMVLCVFNATRLLRQKIHPGSEKSDASIIQNAFAE